MSWNLGSIYIDGLASGIDTSAIIQQIAQIQQRPVQLLEARKSEQTDRLAIYQSLNAMLSGLGMSAGTMTEPASFISYSGVSSDSAALAVTTSSAGAPGSYSVVIETLASAHKVSSGTVADDAEALGYAGDIRINGVTVTIENADSLNNIAAKMNTSGAGVWATVIDYAEDDHRLVVTSRQTGADNAIAIVDANSGDILEGLGLLDSSTSIKHAIADGAESDAFTSSSGVMGDLLELSGGLSGTVQINGTDVDIDLASDTLQNIASRITSEVPDVTASVVSVEDDGNYTYTLRIVGGAGTPSFSDDNNVLHSLGVLTKDAAHEVQAAGDARLSVDGVTVYRPTNSVSDLLDGLTLDLLEADVAKTITVTVAQDTTATTGSVSQLLSVYNAIVDNLRAGQSFDADNETGGVYFGDPSVRLLESGLHSAAMNAVSALGGSITLPSQIGLSTDEYGRLVLDENAFAEALADNPLGVARMFGTSGDTSHADIKYISSTNETVASDANGYAVEITQVAERATATSATLADGVTTDETLTFENICIVQLDAGMSLADAAEEMNSRFQLFDLSLSASVVGDTVVVEHDYYGDSYGFSVSSSLAQGAGGLDIGGAGAGQNADYTGVDVAGTINGETATGNGRYLSGDVGNANTAGVLLRVDATSTGSKGAVMVSQGLGSRLESYISGVMENDTGSMTIATTNIENDIESIDEEIERLEASVERYLTRLRADLLAMETVIAESESLSTYITNQLNGLSTSYGSNS